MGRIERSKRYISEAMVVLLEKKEYDDISINDIVEKSGVSRMTFYRQFHDKKEIVRYLVEEKTNSFMKEIKANKDTKENVVKAFEYMISVKEFTRKIINADLYNLIKEAFDKLVALYVKEDYNAYFISGGVANMYYKYAVNDDNLSSEELTKLLLKLLKIEDFKRQ